MALVKLNEQLSKEIVPGYQARFVHTANMSFVFWDVAAGHTLPEHSHLHEQVAQVLAGKFELMVDGIPYLLEPGQVFIIPPHAKHSGTAITDCKLLDVFFPVREDYKKMT